MARGCRKEGDADGQPAQVQIEGLSSAISCGWRSSSGISGASVNTASWLPASGRSVKTARRRLYAAGIPQAIREDPDGAAAGAG